jgi:hypothetical protein
VLLSIVARVACATVLLAAGVSAVARGRWTRQWTRASSWSLSWEGTIQAPQISALLKRNLCMNESDLI